ncbi:MAG: hypothetical protein WC568_10330 [Candidatus Methanoperedens sp.]
MRKWLLRSKIIETCCGLAFVTEIIYIMSSYDMRSIMLLFCGVVDGSRIMVVEI